MGDEDVDEDTSGAKVTAYVMFSVSVRAGMTGGDDSGDELEIDTDTVTAKIRVRISIMERSARGRLKVRVGKSH